MPPVPRFLPRISWVVHWTVPRPPEWSRSIPGPFHLVAPDKERLVAVHGLQDKPFIGISYALGAEGIGKTQVQHGFLQLDALADSRLLVQHFYFNPLVGLQADHQLVLGQVFVTVLEDVVG